MYEIPFIDVKSGKSVDQASAYFAFRLDSISASSGNELQREKFIAQELQRQIDFIATLPALGEGNAIELRFLSEPIPEAPTRGRIEVVLRVRVMVPDHEEPKQHAGKLYRAIRANLLSMSGNYDWVPIGDETHYRRLFHQPEATHICELVRREAYINLDRIDVLPPRRAIGFVEAAAPMAPPEDESDRVYFCFSFLHNHNTLERFFDVLLLQQQSLVISIALSPTNITSAELEFLLEQATQCERYIQLPTNGPVFKAAEFVPPLRNQARILLEEIQRRIFSLRDDCFLIKLQVAGTEPTDAALMEALGVTITSAVATGATASGPRLQTASLGGGYDWFVPKGERQQNIARTDFECMTFNGLRSLVEKPGGGRIRYLFDAQEANCSFRLPIPAKSEFPGLNTRLSRSVAPPVCLPSSGLLLGDNNYRGVKQPVRLLPDDRRRHAYIVGQTGTGKSTLLLNMIMQDIENGAGVGVLDPHGSLVDQILLRIPPHRLKDVIYIDPEDQQAIVGMNILEYRDDLDRDSAVNHLLEIFDSLYNMKQAGGPMFEMYLRNSALLAMTTPGEPATLDDILRVFLDRGFRNQKLKACDDHLVLEFWSRIATKLTSEDWSLTNMAAYVNSKFSSMLYNRFIRRIVLQQKSTVDVLNVMDDGKILLVNLCKGKLGKTNSSFLGMILISLFQRAAFSRQGRSQDQQLRDFYLYVDEFQNLATETFASILSEARKYRLNMILTNQYLHQLSDEVRDAVLGNVGTLVGFRLGMRDAELLEKEFGPVVDQSDLMNLPNYQTYVSTLFRGEVTKPFNFRTRHEQFSESPGAQQKIRQGMSAYTQTIEQVDRAIAARRSRLDS